MIRPPARLARRAAQVAPLTLLLGCAAGISTHVTEPAPLRQPVDVRALAVMPPSVAFGSEWLKSPTMESLVRALEDRFPAIEIVRPEDAARRLTAQSMAAEYASLLEDFERAGVVDPERVELIAEAVGATHFLHLHAGYSGERRLRATSSLFDDEPLFYSANDQSVYVVARLWASSTSAPAWEALAQSRSERGPLSRDRSPPELIDPLVVSLVERIPLAESPAAGRPDA